MVTPRLCVPVNVTRCKAVRQSVGMERAAVQERCAGAQAADGGGKRAAPLDRMTRTLFASMSTQHSLAGRRAPEEGRSATAGNPLSAVVRCFRLQTVF